MEHRGDRPAGTSGIEPGASQAPAVSGAEPLRIAVELGSRRAFATALDWPGWCRSGKSESQAIENLLAYRLRYAAVLARAGQSTARIPEPMALVLPPDPRPLVVERLAGGSGTDFGAPGQPADDESRPTTSADGARLAAILAACWEAFDVISGSAPESLRKGPRGGGRDRSKIVAHVIEAEAGYYARRLGVRHPAFAPDDVVARDALRADILAVLRAPSDGGPVVEKGWTVRFAARYMAWHVLDHAWEIEDRRP
jgi:hypothetical protein